MRKTTPHRFQKKADITCEQYFRVIHVRAVNLARELKETLSSEKAFKIIVRAYFNSSGLKKISLTDSSST